MIVCLRPLVIDEMAGKSAPWSEITFNSNNLNKQSCSKTGASTDILVHNNTITIHVNRMRFRNN